MPCKDGHRPDHMYPPLSVPPGPRTVGRAHREVLRFLGCFGLATLYGLFLVFAAAGLYRLSH